MKLILSIYDHSVVILHVDFSQDVFSNRGVFVLDYLDINTFFPTSLINK